MPLHPQAVAMLATMPSVWTDVDAVASMTAAKARALGGAHLSVTDVSASPGVAVEDVELPGAAGPLRGRVYRPSAGPPSGTIVWIRGGGFVLGSLATDWAPAPLAAAAGCTVVAVEYRLAPEHPYPCGLEDCYSALRWAAERAPALGGRAEPIGLGGESAGGNLAAAAALMARARGGPEIALQVLLYPMIARVFDGASRRDPEVGALARTEAIEWVWQQYLGDRDGTDPLACPLSAESLAGLPPALVVTAEYDVLRDEGEAYAKRLAREGVAVELRRHDGMPHGFAEWIGDVDAADECIGEIGAAFRRALSPSERMKSSPGLRPS